MDRIGGSAVDTTVLVGTGASPATYEPRPRQMNALGAAKLYFSIGVPFESVWLPRLREANPTMQVVALAEAAPDHDHIDPHVWTNPRRALALAEAVRAALSAADPANAERFATAFAGLRDELLALDAELRTLFAGHAGKAFLVFHPAWGHLAGAYGFEQIAIEHGGKTQGARQLAGLIETVRSRGIDTLFVQPQFGVGSARKIAGELGVKVVQADPLAEDYIVNLRQVAGAIAGALR